MKYWHVKYKKRVLPRSIRHTSNSESALTFRPGCVLLSRTLSNMYETSFRHALRRCATKLFIYFLRLRFRAIFTETHTNTVINIALQQISRCVRLGSVWLHPGGRHCLFCLGEMTNLRAPCSCQSCTVYLGWRQTWVIGFATKVEVDFCLFELRCITRHHLANAFSNTKLDFEYK